ncbi:MAG: hypothetical protein WA908_05700 [Pontixanthobacter sp.]
MSQQVIECVTFRLIDGTDPLGFARIAEDLNTWISRQPGFIARALSCAADGEWIDHVTWASMEDAEAAAAKLEQAPEAGPFMSAIKPASVTMRHAALTVTA